MANGGREIQDNIIPLEEGLPYNHFTIDVPGDGNCFFYAVLLSLKTNCPGFYYFLDNKLITDISDDRFITTLLEYARRQDITDENIINPLSIKTCWAGQEIIVFLINTLGFNINIYNINREPIIVNSYSKPGQECLIELIYTGNHYMAYFDNSKRSEFRSDDILSNQDILESVLLNKSIQDNTICDEELAAVMSGTKNIDDVIPECRDIVRAAMGYPPTPSPASTPAPAPAPTPAASGHGSGSYDDDPFETLISLKKALSITKETPQEILNEIKKLTREDVSVLEARLRSMGYLSKYYTKYLKYKRKYIALKNKI